MQGMDAYKEKWVFLEVYFVNNDILAHALGTWNRNWRFNSHRFEKTLLQKIEFHYSLVLQILNNVFSSCLYSREYLLQENYFYVWVNLHVAYEVSCRGLNCLHSSQEEGNQLIYNHVVVSLEKLCAY